ncbi:hypothetical protein B0T16DRAFT_237591 [Cercophora newfieldiana]|uniref:Uncharacterized protein n=1 Tax=Cercophora newfieldiana TaxID=92897 RepID=A0AA40CIW7_9PEZI|nr:hypothetical protein B0T16DRAFT_237591 [Cercophora newfieldiana]
MQQRKSISEMTRYQSIIIAHQQKLNLRASCHNLLFTNQHLGFPPNLHRPLRVLVVKYIPSMLAESVHDSS